MNVQRWFLLLMIILLHLVIILGCIFGDSIINCNKRTGLTPSVKSRHRQRSVKRALDHYLCIEEKAFPYAMAFIIVFLTIFLLGLAKGLIGLICSRRIGMFGLDLLLDLPHPINCYYEPELACEEVIYDEKGWPIHPTTHKRTRIINESSELCINSVFFFAFPFFVIWVALQNTFSCYESANTCVNTNASVNNVKSSFDCDPYPRQYKDIERDLECPEVCPKKSQKSKSKIVKCSNKSCPTKNSQPPQTKSTSSKCEKYCKKLDTYPDDGDSTEEKDTKYVKDQLTKSEEKLNEVKIERERRKPKFLEKY